MTLDAVLRRRWARVLIGQALGAGLFFLGIWVVPHRWCARSAADWYAGDARLQASLARGVEGWLDGRVSEASFNTGHGLFDGEWQFGTYMMAAMGFGQTALEHPEFRARHAALMDRCIERILSPQVRAFDQAAWDGQDPLESLDGAGGHAAYLGYLNMALSMRRLVAPKSPHVELNDRITAALARRIEKSPTMLLDTYPLECFPVDNCAVIGSLGLYDQATGADHGDLIRRWSARCREKYIDRRTGLLIQAVLPRDGAAGDAPRGSGTMLGLYFLSFADAKLSGELYAAARRELAGTVLGFGAMREYPRGFSGRGDIDSGPIIGGYGISPTGFGIAGSRIHGDPQWHRRLVATACCAGAPLAREGRLNFVTGGPLGDAILFAMLTALPAERLKREPRP